MFPLICGFQIFINTQKVTYIAVHESKQEMGKKETQRNRSWGCGWKSVRNVVYSWRNHLMKPCTVCSKYIPKMNSSLHTELKTKELSKLPCFLKLLFPGDPEGKTVKDEYLQNQEAPPAFWSLLAAHLFCLQNLSILSLKIWVWSHLWTVYWWREKVNV